jgi:hypothetical protein
MASHDTGNALLSHWHSGIEAATSTITVAADQHSLSQGMETIAAGLRV